MLFCGGSKKHEINMTVEPVATVDRHEIILERKKVPKELLPPGICFSFPLEDEPEMLPWLEKLDSPRSTAISEDGRAESSDGSSSTKSRVMSGVHEIVESWVSSIMGYSTTQL
eukprot:GEMP01011409.1.p3 GENE.GEMP01011409.1~~GEMP01011409.1.p3  ORF type:complete len:123 (+),score=16.70 GEMP01011409.1:32-370(+)